MDIKSVYDVTIKKDITSKTILSLIREAKKNKQTSFPTPYGTFTLGDTVLGVLYVTSQRYIQPKFKKGKK